MEIITTAAEVYTPPAESVLHSTRAYLGDQRPPGTPVCLTQYDQTLPLLAVQLLSGSQPYAVPEDGAVNIRAKKPDGTYVYNSALGVDSARTTAYIQVTPQMTVCVGRIAPVLEVVVSGGVACTGTLALEIEPNPVPENAIESLDEYTAVTQLAAEATAAAAAAAASEKAALASQTDASASANTAKSSQSAAASSAAAAQTSQTAAAASAAAAAQSQSSAAGSAVDAANSAAAAKDYADSLADTAEAVSAAYDLGAAAQATAIAASEAASAAQASADAAAGAAAAAQSTADAAMPKAGGAFTGTVRRTGETAAHLGGEFYNIRVVSSDYDTVLGGYRFIDFQLK